MKPHKIYQQLGCSESTGYNTRKRLQNAGWLTDDGKIPASKPQDPDQYFKYWLNQKAGKK